MGRITSTNVLFLELCLNYVQVLKMCGKAIDIHQCNAQAQRTRVCAKTTCYASGFVFEWDTWCSLIALVLPRGCCRNSAAKLAASWARFTKLAASMVIYAKLAVSMAVQAILGAFLAALGSMIMLARFSRFIVGLLKLRISAWLQICRQAFCFSCAFHMRQRIGTKLDVYGCFDSPLNAQIREKPPLNTHFTSKNHP